jgi:hypothetical protein
MYIFIKLLQITLLLFISLTLAVIPWIPSLVTENIVNFTIVGFFILAGYLVYLTIKRLDAMQKKRKIYKNTAYTLLFFTYIGLFAIAQIGVSLGKSKYVKTYEFEALTFYIYETIEGSSEVSLKEAWLPMRSVPIATFPYAEIILNKEEMYLYGVGEDIHIKVYDFKNNMAMNTIQTKE